MFTSVYMEMEEAGARSEPEPVPEDGVAFNCLLLSFSLPAKLHGPLFIIPVALAFCCFPSSRCGEFDYRGVQEEEMQTRV